MHARGPRLNGWLASSLSSPRSIHLSGRNSVGFLKFEDKRGAAKEWVETRVYEEVSKSTKATVSVEHTPAGSQYPSTVSPPCGTTRVSGPGTGDMIRIASSTTALT